MGNKGAVAGRTERGTKGGSTEGRVNMSELAEGREKGKDMPRRLGSSGGSAQCSRWAEGGPLDTLGELQSLLQLWTSVRHSWHADKWYGSFINPESPILNQPWVSDLHQNPQPETDAGEADNPLGSKVTQPEGGGSKPPEVCIKC